MWTEIVLTFPDSRFGAFLTNTQFTVVTEIFPNHLRATASSGAISALFLAQTIWLEAAPYAISAISWRYYMIFAICCSCGTFLVYFCVPEVSTLRIFLSDPVFIEPESSMESGTPLSTDVCSPAQQTMNIPLEELDELFGQQVARHFAEIDAEEVTNIPVEDVEAGSDKKSGV